MWGRALFHSENSPADFVVTFPLADLWRNANRTLNDTQRRHKTEPAEQSSRRESRLAKRALGRKDVWRSASPCLPAGALHGSYLTADEIQLFLRKFGVGKSHNIFKKSFQGRKLFRIIKFYLCSTQILEWRGVNSFPCLVPEECIQLWAIKIQLHMKSLWLSHFRDR